MHSSLVCWQEIPATSIDQKPEAAEELFRVPAPLRFEGTATPAEGEGHLRASRPFGRSQDTTGSHLPSKAPADPSSTGDSPRAGRTLPTMLLHSRFAGVFGSRDHQLEGCILITATASQLIPFRAVLHVTSSKAQRVQTAWALVPHCSPFRIRLVHLRAPFTCSLLCPMEQEEWRIGGP